MAHKRRPTEHQKQIRFLGVLFGILMILVVVGVILLLNWPVGGWHRTHPLPPAPQQNH